MGRKDFEKIGTIKEKRTLRVSGQGGGYYLHLPRDLIDLYHIMTGDRIQVELGDHFREKGPEEAEEKGDE